jgi:serine protease AprX
LLILAFAGSLLGGCAAAQDQSPMESVIISGTDTQNVSQLVARYGGKVTSELDVIHGVAAEIPVSAEAQIRSEPGIRSVEPNGEVKAEHTPAVAAIAPGGKVPATDYPDEVGADSVWAQGARGENVTVAVVDTGINPIQGLAKGFDRRHDNRIVGWVDFVEKSRKPTDPNGHGTHVAGIIGNSDTGSDREYNGVAPAVNLVSVRVLNREGSGTYETVLKGIDWVVKHQDEYQIRVMNLSLVGQTDAPYWADPLNIAVTQAWANGITVIVAAGNAGPDPLTIGAPGNNPYAVTVGAFTDHYTVADWNDDYITSFSSAGPTQDMFVKPDVVAPGAHIVSIMAPDSYIARQHEANKVQGQYFEMSGTSQSAAVVSGVVALMISQTPDLTPDQVKSRLLSTAFPWVDPTTDEAIYSVWQQGAGRVNAVDATFSDSLDSANQGMDIQADLAGSEHYIGYTAFNPETGEYSLQGDYSLTSGKYGLWSGGYGLWSGGYGLWSGKYGLWSGKYGLWSGKYGLWSGGFGVWTGSYGLWSGKYGLWSGKYGLWSGSTDVKTDLNKSPVTIETWVEEH